MAVTRARAVKVLNVPEFRLYEASRRGHVNDHGATRLRKLVESARKHRDKQKARLKQQRAEARGKRDPRNQRMAREAENTQLKLELFQDILERFETALGKAEARPDPDRPKPRRAAQKREQKVVARKAAKKKPAGSKASSTKRAPAGDKSPRNKAATKRAQKRATSTLATEAPKGIKRQRKGQVSATRAHLAHSAARGRRTQARRDRRG